MLRFGALFSLSTHNGDGIPIRKTPEFSNMVLDSGLDRMSAGTWIDRCAVGTSGVAVLPSQLSLQGFVASTTINQNTTTGIDTTNNYYWVRRVWRFNPRGESSNISEVGSGWGNAQMWNRALILDTNNNPTTLTWLGDEYLDVTEEIRVYMPAELTSTLELKNKTTGVVISSHNIVIKPFYNLSQTAFVAGRLSLGSTFYYSSNPLPPSPTAGVYSNSNVENLSITTTYPTPRSMSATATTTLASTMSISCAQTALLNLFVSSPLGNGFKWSITPPITQAASEEATLSFTASWGRV